MKKSISFFAVVPSGVESLLVDELKGLGAVGVSASRSGAFFQGELATGYRACLWLRTANRVLLPLSRFRAETPDALYQGVQQIRWERHMEPEGSFAVDFTSSRSRIHHSRYGALKVKDAVVDQFREGFGTRPSVNLLRPDIRLNVYLVKDEATLSLDLSGESLHKRGYRGDAGSAPLKENLAAAILLRAGWPEISERGGGLMDPMTGSGTLPIEAALMAAGIAPGLLRTYYGFLKWKGHRPEIWERLLDEARGRRAAGLRRLPPIVGYDADPGAVRNALVNLERAGLRGAVHVEKRELADLVPHPGMKGPPGLVVINPPYGERLGEMCELRSLYADLGMRLKNHFNGWRVSLFTGNAELGKEMGLRAEKKYSLYNGPIACKLLNFRIGPEWVRKRQQGPIISSTPANGRPCLDPGALMFANRLRKNLKRLRRQFKKENVTCFRVYDQDLPEYAVAVDIYGKWVHVQEYRAPESVDPEKAEARLRQVLIGIGEVLGVPGKHIFLKVRRRQKGRAQYMKQENKRVLHEVDENHCRFLVNFTDYIDTGLFLDQRITRNLIGKLAGGKQFLNLFCYTGTATVAAARGGARSTTSVDASRVYLDWARQNLALNGFDRDRHFFYQADVLNWLRDESRSYDLVLMDPPTFSNSKRFRNILDIQRDHVNLIRSAAKVLKRDGILLFSCNFRKFKMDIEALEGFGLEDLSRITLPPDFERRPQIHHCWKITRQKI